MHHMVFDNDQQVKAIPGMLQEVQPFMRQIMHQIEELFDVQQGSTRYRNDNEPHLVKYTGTARRL